MRTREDHRNELAEDYVELIYRLGGFEDLRPIRNVELVEALGVSQPTVTKALERLRQDGLVTVRPREDVSLTDQGLAMARASLERHRLIVEFLVSLGVDATQAEIDTEGIEHHVSEQTVNAMKRYLVAQSQQKTPQSE